MQKVWQIANTIKLCLHYVDRKARLALYKWTSLSKESNAQILSDVLSATKNNAFQSPKEHRMWISESQIR